MTILTAIAIGYSIGALVASTRIWAGRRVVSRATSIVEGF
jgi:hypothetical protein